MFQKCNLANNTCFFLQPHLSYLTRAFQFNHVLTSGWQDTRTRPVDLTGKLNKVTSETMTREKPSPKWHCPQPQAHQKQWEQNIGKGALGSTQMKHCGPMWVRVLQPRTGTCQATLITSQYSSVNSVCPQRQKPALPWQPLAGWTMDN